MKKKKIITVSINGENPSADMFSCKLNVDSNKKIKLSTWARENTYSANEATVTTACSNLWYVFDATDNTKQLKM